MSPEKIYKNCIRIVKINSFLNAFLYLKMYQGRIFIAITGIMELMRKFKWNINEFSVESNLSLHLLLDLQN